MLRRLYGESVSPCSNNTPPFARNSDGTYSYQGDDTQLNLMISDTLSMASSDTAKSIMEGALNTGRTQATLQPPSVNDGKVTVSDGLITSNQTYNKSFADGQPYSLEFTSSTQFILKDATGKDVTSEVPGNGTFDATKEGAHSVSLRGVKFDIDLNLGDIPAADKDAAVAGKVVEDWVWAIATNGPACQARVAQRARKGSNQMNSMPGLT